MRKNIVAGNWKMNKTLQEGIALAKELNEALANEKPNCDVIICTPFIHLASVTPLVDAAKITLGRLPGITWRKAGMTSNHHAPYDLGYTRATMA